MALPTASDRIAVNVGGRLFETTTTTVKSTASGLTAPRMSGGTSSKKMQAMRIPMHEALKRVLAMDQESSQWQQQQREFQQGEGRWLEERRNHYRCCRRVAMLSMAAYLIMALHISQKSLPEWPDFSENSLRQFAIQSGIKASEEQGVYITFIVATRMDGDYAGDSTNRFKRCISVLIEQLNHITKETGKRAEIIVVEWEPVPGHERVHKFLDKLYSLEQHDPTTNSEDQLDSSIKTAFSDQQHMTEVRVITVPSSVAVARNLDHFMEFHAKNVGIRRARGKWTVTFNQDVLFPPALLKVMFSGNLQPNSFYRTTLHQFHDQTLYDAGINSSVSELQQKADEDSAKVYTKALSKWPKLRHEFANDACRFSCDETENPNFQTHPDISSTQFQEQCRKLDYQSSGDFELATTKAWHDVGGFYESKGNNHVDSYQLAHFRSHGYEQVILDQGCNILHQLHASGRKERRDGITRAWMPAFENCIEQRSRAVKLAETAKQIPNATFIPPEPPELCAPAENTLEFGYLHHQFEEHKLYSVL